MSLPIKFAKISAADFSKESAFLLPLSKIHCAIISFSGSAEVAAGLSNLFGEGFCVGAIGFRRHFATLPIHVAPSLCARLRIGVSRAPLKGPLHIIYLGPTDVPLCSVEFNLAPPHRPWAH